MCKAASEGGQRCHGHAMKAFEAAAGKLADASTRSDYKQQELRQTLRDRMVDLATTDQGRDRIRQMSAGATHARIDPERADLRPEANGGVNPMTFTPQQYGSILREGELLRERNKQVAAVHAQEVKSRKRAGLRQALVDAIKPGAATGIVGTVAAGHLAQGNEGIAALGGTLAVVAGFNAYDRWKESRAASSKADQAEVQRKERLVRDEIHMKARREDADAALRRMETTESGGGWSMPRDRGFNEDPPGDDSAPIGAWAQHKDVDKSVLPQEPEWERTTARSRG